MNPDVKVIMAADDTAELVAGELIAGPRGGRISLGRVKSGVFVPTNAGTAKLIELDALPGADEPEPEPVEEVVDEPDLPRAERVGENEIELHLSDSVDLEDALGD